MNKLEEILKEANIRLEERKVEKDDILAKLKEEVKSLGGFQEEDK